MIMTGLFLKVLKVFCWMRCMKSLRRISQPLVPESCVNRVLYSAGLHDCRDIEMCFVSRTYFTRHGAGFFPTECSAKDLFGEDKQDATNVWNEFQGSFRYGYFEEDRFRNVCGQEFKRAKRMYPYTKLSFAFTHADETDVWFWSLSVIRRLKMLSLPYLQTVSIHQSETHGSMLLKLH